MNEKYGFYFKEKNIKGRCEVTVKVSYIDSAGILNKHFCGRRAEKDRTNYSHPYKGENNLLTKTNTHGATISELRCRILFRYKSETGCLIMY